MFMWVVILIVLFIFCIGLFDYYLLKYFFKWMEWIWIIFMIMIVLFVVIVLIIMRVMKGDKVLMN